MSDLSLAAEDLGALLLASLLPALLWLIYIRRTEHYQREPWANIAGAFLWGAFIATLVAAFLELLLLDLGASVQNGAVPELTFLNPSSPWNLFFAVLVVAPFIEEGLKAIGTVRSVGTLRSIADGPVMGASVGLGFGFFETFLYGVAGFLTGGLVAGIVLILIRSVSSVLLHASSTAMFGYGYATGTVQGSNAPIGGYYLLAVTMHATFNLLASLGTLLPLIGISALDPTTASLIGLLCAIGFAAGAFQHVATIVAESSFPGASGVHPKYRPPTVHRRTP